MVLGGSSSAPNLQDYAHAHRKKLTSSGFLDGMCKHAHTPSNGESPSLPLGNLGVLCFLCEATGARIVLKLVALEEVIHLLLLLLLFRCCGTYEQH